MKKKFNVITILSLLGLIVASSITLGKVFAYFGSKSLASGAIEMGTLSIGGVTKGDGTGIDWNIGNLQPNQSFGGSYKVEVNSNINYYIRILFKASVTPQSGSIHINGTACEDYVTDDTDILSIGIDGNYSKSNIKTADGYTPYYRLTPTKVTSDTTTETFNIDLKINDWVGCNYCHYYMKASVVVNMRVQVMQADYLESSSEGGTVSTVDEMHDLWVAGGLETKIDDISDYPDLTFTVLSANDNTMSVKAANTSITTANIPAMVKNGGEVYTVTEIAYNGFYNCSNLTSITIPDTVTSIGYRAFECCSSLTSITIPSSVTSIGYNAFYKCTALTSISIPDSVTYIGSSAFYGCSNLQYNTYDNAKYLGNSTNPYVVLVDTTTSDITSCDINSNCKMIYYQAFYGCKSLTSITIHDSVTNIGTHAFANCTNLTSVKLSSSITKIPSDMFYYCTSLASITIPEGVTSISNDAFYNCKSLTSVTIPDTVTSVGEHAFEDCSSLTSIDIPSGVTSIGYEAFEDCTSLAFVTIPDSVTYIGSSAFYGCSNLQYNTYDNAKYLGNDSNAYVVLVDTTSTSITSCTINSNCKIIYYRAFCNCKSLTSVTIPDTVTSVGEHAFEDCSSLTSIDIPSGVTSIGVSAFYNCSSLTSITIPNSVTIIGSYAFAGCSKLTSIVIPNSVISIGEYAFATKGNSAQSNATITYAGTAEQMKSIHDISYYDDGGACYKINCSDGNFTIYQFVAPEPCVWIETEIDCWDEKRKRRYKKKIKDLTYDDDILVWDFDNGCFATAKAMYITRPRYARSYSLLTFSDGSTLKTIGASNQKRHRIFNVDTGRFEYSGHDLKVGTRVFNSKGEIVTVTSNTLVKEKIEHMNVVTKRHFNMFANGILTSFRSNNMYEIKDMKYVKDDRPIFENTFDIDAETWEEMRLGEQFSMFGTNFDLLEKFRKLKTISKPRE